MLLICIEFEVGFLLSQEVFLYCLAEVLLGSHLVSGCFMPTSSHLFRW